MNSHQSRADAARDRKPLDRAAMIRLACDHLANSTSPTVTGATLILPDGSTTYLSADDARVFYNKGEPENPA